MKKCPDCQVNLKGWETFCPKCSSDLFKAEQRQQNQVRKWRLF